MIPNSVNTMAICLQMISYDFESLCRKFASLTFFFNFLSLLLRSVLLSLICCIKYNNLPPATCKGFHLNNDTKISMIIATYHEANDDNQQKYCQNDVAGRNSALSRIHGVDNDGDKQTN